MLSRLLPQCVPHKAQDAIQEVLLSHGCLSASEADGRCVGSTAIRQLRKVDASSSQILFRNQSAHTVDVCGWLVRRIWLALRRPVGQWLKCWDIARTTAVFKVDENILGPGHLRGTHLLKSVGTCRYCACCINPTTGTHSTHHCYASTVQGCMLISDEIH